MKQLSLIVLLAFVMAACETEAPKENTQNSDVVETTTSDASLNGNKKIDLEQSKIFWKGYKIIGNHSGTINLSAGQLEFKDGNIVSGSFVVDMNSVVVSDLMDSDHHEEEDEEPHDEKSELAAHLMDADFFDAKQFPKAEFVLKTASLKENGLYAISGDMTIKGVSQPIAFDATLENNKIAAHITIDRTLFGIKYGSGSFFSDLGDRAINDEFTLDVNLSFL